MLKRYEGQAEQQNIQADQERPYLISSVIGKKKGPPATISFHDFNGVPVNSR